MEEINKNEHELPISIVTSFTSLEQKLVFEAVVLPEIENVLLKYGSLLVDNK